MMRTITIDIFNEKVFKLLQDLELLQLIRLRGENETLMPGSLPVNYKGAMSRQSISDIDEQLHELRNAWE